MMTLQEELTQVATTLAIAKKNAIARETVLKTLRKSELLAIYNSKMGVYGMSERHNTTQIINEILRVEFHVERIESRVTDLQEQVEVEALWAAK